MSTTFADKAKGRRAANQKLGRSEIMAILDYDPQTGLFRWKASRGAVRAGAVAGCVDTKGYIVITINFTSYKAHRIAWLIITGEWPDRDIDHINMVRSDNRQSNLRLATKSENAANTGAQINNKLGVRGVCRRARGKNPFQVSIMVSGRRIQLGRHPTLEAATAAYDEAAKKYFGEFARPA
jgi:hypothetical protein